MNIIIVYFLINFGLIIIILNKRWLRYKSRYNTKKNLIQKRSLILLSATDEALADLFAVAYTGLPNYMAVSLTTDKARLISEQRGLEGDFAEKTSYEDLLRSNLEENLQRYCPAKSYNFTNSKFNIYCLATIIAKVFYEACDKNTSEIASIALPIIHSALPVIGDKIKIKI